MGVGGRVDVEEQERKRSLQGKFTVVAQNHGEGYRNWECVVEKPQIQEEVPT